MSRRRDVFLPPIVLDRGASAPLHEQVSGQIARAIRSGAPFGARLPSTRMLARLLGVSRNTVMTAYDDLAAAGLIQGCRGSSMLVDGRRSRGLHPFNLGDVLSDAQYPVKTLGIADPDGTPLYLSFRGRSTSPSRP